MEENKPVLLSDEDGEAPDTCDGELIGYDWDAEDGRATEVTEEDWDVPARDEDAADKSGESFRLKHLGREFDVTRDEVIALAQKGADYDRIRSRADALAENLRLRGAEGTFTDDQRRELETREFLSVYQGVQPEDIPQEVWSEVSSGRSLLTAYQSYENRKLRTELEAGRREMENRRKSTGPRPTLGTAGEHGELEADWYRE